MPVGLPLLASVSRPAVELDVVRPSGSVRTVVEGGVSLVSLAAGRARLYSAAARRSLGGHLRPAAQGRTSNGDLHTGWAFTNSGGGLRLISSRFHLPASSCAILGIRLDHWNGFGSDVLAVADGVVVAALDDTLDEAAQPVAPENASGNYVAIDIGSGQFAFYEHIQRGSVAVKAQQRVRRGQVIARLGSSGSTSIGPHLHFHVAAANSLLR